jgi:uncharacterized repeat protein (TIGR03803 family)
MTPAGTLTTVYNFCVLADCADGAVPNAPLLQASDGNFYGTTSAGGTHRGGSVFRVTAAGKLTTLYSFCAQVNCADGDDPQTGLIQGTDGNFYGTTEGGGTSSGCHYGCGTIFRITPAGKLTTLHSFSVTDGTSPSSGLLQGTDGDFYGATPGGGANNGGTVYSLSTGLGPFVLARPGSGKVGANVVILGNNLKGTTSVSFNGTAAAFIVASGSEITAKVPAGATTGKIDVTTPRGTLTSNQKFRVTP